MAEEWLGLVRAAECIPKDCGSSYQSWPFAIATPGYRGRNMICIADWLYWEMRSLGSCLMLLNKLTRLIMATLLLHAIYIYIIQSHLSSHAFTVPIYTARKLLLSPKHGWNVSGRKEGGSPPVSLLHWLPNTGGARRRMPIMHSLGTSSKYYYVPPWSTHFAYFCSCCAFPIYGGMRCSPTHTK